MRIMNKSQRRYYQVAGITLQVESDLPIGDTTFHPKFRGFEVEEPGEDVIALHHHFELPRLQSWNLEQEIYRRPPWIICKDQDRWIYLGVELKRGKLSPVGVAVFNEDHSHGEMFSRDSRIFEKGLLGSLTIFPTDQILLGRLLADRQGCILHASGVILNGQGLMFLGHSEAGKSTITKMVSGRAEILCDDRIILRRWPDRVRIHGTWSHGEVPIVSRAGAPLSAAFFLKKSERNCLTRVDDQKRILGMLLGCLIKPLCTADWWDKTLTTMEIHSRQIRWYNFEFDKTGGIVDLLEQFTGSDASK
jgi:hypothetical protein